MKTYRFKFIFLAFLSICLVKQVYPQSPASDSSFHPYYVNYWISGTISGVGLLVNSTGISKVMHKVNITRSEIQALNRDIINGFDSWALNQDPSQIDAFNNYSNYTNKVLIILPALLLFDKQIRQDWLDILLMYSEVTFITSNFFNYSFLGPSYQSRFRPVTYYEQLPDGKRLTGNNRNSFYSGHVASASAITFFMVKVYSDYNPDIGNNKYLLYAAAAIPPLVSGYFRVRSLNHFPSDAMVGLGVGALIGIVIPEFHRVHDKNIRLSLFSSPESTGIAINWQPDFLK
jgi:hypothetical protein